MTEQTSGAREAELIELIAAAGRDAASALHLGAEQLAAALARANAHIAVCAALGHLFAGRTAEGKAAAALLTGDQAERGIDAAIDLIDLLLDRTPAGIDAAAFLAEQDGSGGRAFDSIEAASALRHALTGQDALMREHLARLEPIALGNLGKAAGVLLAAIADTRAQQAIEGPS